ncbi:MAG: glycosyltransferase family 4 protein [Candidatus Thiodiazotropha sp. (ex Lucinoma borealis)]|nr:glycosyltransferase family 4 protein [Candidatus Thiodiazotropha sp. (ex Lucinoma borealis)]
MNNRYRILITISELIYSSQVRNLYDLLSLIDTDVFDVEVGALATGNEAQADIESLGFKVFRLRLQPTRGFNSEKLLDLLKGPLIIRKKKYDLVHSFLYQSLFSEPFFFKLLTKTKYIYTKSNLEWDNHPKNWNKKSELADRIISISNATDDLLKEQGFQEKIAKIYLGIDTEHFKYSKEKGDHLRRENNIPLDAVVFGCAAQFIEMKEQIILLKAFELVAAENSNVYLIYCGPNHRDDYYKKFIYEIDNSKYKDRIRELGSLGDMPSFYSAINCFVLASRFETFGYVYVEAMSCGIPVIACRAAGPLEIIIDGETGYFTEMSNPDSLSEQMSKYLLNPHLLTEHGKSSRKRVIEIFSKETMARKMMDLYVETLSA